MDVSKLCPHCMREMQSAGNFCPYCGKDVKDLSAGLHQLNPFTILQGKYLVGSVLGEGGFGITYIGIDMNLEIRVAIKEFYPNGFVSRDHTQTTVVTQFNNSNTEAVRKWKEGFVKEARSLGKCQNLPGIVGVKDFFEENGTAYIVMEYVDGTTLKTYVKDRGGKLEPAKLLPAIRPVMSSLQKVHDTGVIHRDISPDNLMFMPDGSMKLLDFGAARSFAEADVQKSLSVMLKPGYAPEEQYRTHGNQGPWTDVYALAATIYRCITGVMPVESMERMRSDTLKSPKDLGVNISDQENAAIMKGMAVYAENRFQSVREFEQALYEGAPISSPAPAPAPTPAPAPASGPASAAPKAAPSPEPASAPAKKSNTPVFIGIGAIAVILVAAIAINLSKGSSTTTTATTETASKQADTTASDTQTKSSDKTDTVAESTEEAVEEAQEASADVWHNAYENVLKKYNSKAGAMYTLVDINGDDIPELIVSDEDSIELATCSREGDVDKVYFANATCAFSQSDRHIYISEINSNTVKDYVYGVSDGTLNLEQNGYMELALDGNADLNCNCYKDDSPASLQSYLSWTDGMYRSASTLSSVPFISLSDADNKLSSIESISDLSYYGNEKFETGSLYNEYSCNGQVQIFVAPDNSTYYFNLKGGAGGADGLRVVQFGYNYDYDGATLRGTMDLNYGDKIFIVVGGAGGCPPSADYGTVVQGGFNGGGNAYWSGSGGGCTDIYYRDGRAASAAGGGGGNYNPQGETGRTSGSSGGTTGGKNGQSIENVDAGGGGAGWVGGTAGGRDGAGRGGISGCDRSVFRITDESTGGFQPDAGQANGYCIING